eukprot:6284926-Amphidinium_carterae.1
MASNPPCEGASRMADEAEQMEIIETMANHLDMISEARLHVVNHPKLLPTSGHATIKIMTSDMY